MQATLLSSHPPSPSSCKKSFTNSEGWLALKQKGTETENLPLFLGRTSNRRRRLPNAHREKEGRPQRTRPSRGKKIFSGKTGTFLAGGRGKQSASQELCEPGRIGSAVESRFT